MSADYDTYSAHSAHSAHSAARDALKAALMQACIPLAIETIGLLTDAVKELREQLQDDAQARRECAPLHRQLNYKRLQAELEDLDVQRAEEKADREERAEERKMAALEREERAAQIEANRADRADRAERKRNEEYKTNSSII